MSSSILWQYRATPSRATQAAAWIELISIINVERKRLLSRYEFDPADAEDAASEAIEAIFRTLRRYTFGCERCERRFFLWAHFETHLCEYHGVRATPRSPRVEIDRVVRINFRSAARMAATRILRQLQTYRPVESVALERSVERLARDFEGTAYELMEIVGVPE